MKTKKSSPPSKGRKNRIGKGDSLGTLHLIARVTELLHSAFLGSKNISFEILSGVRNEVAGGWKTSRPDGTCKISIEIKPPELTTDSSVTKRGAL